MWPVAISLSASPVPTPRNTRPGYRHAMVAKACARTAGLYRKVGVRTDVPSCSLEVRSPTAVSQESEKGAWRSEEHTSELQARGHLVCRLLLEQKTSSRN